MGAKIQAFDIFQTPLSSHYPLPLSEPTILGGFCARFPFRVLIHFVSKIFCVIENQYVHTAKSFSFSGLKLTNLGEKISKSSKLRNLLKLLFSKDFLLEDIHKNISILWCPVHWVLQLKLKSTTPHGEISWTVIEAGILLLCSQKDQPRL